jgi:hypothetical protein
VNVAKFVTADNFLSGKREIGGEKERGGERERKRDRLDWVQTLNGRREFII